MEGYLHSYGGLSSVMLRIRSNVKGCLEVMSRAIINNAEGYLAVKRSIMISNLECAKGAE